MLLLNRLQARDRALYEVLVLPTNGSARWRAAFTFLTHAGGARATVFATLAPLAFADPWYSLGMHALLTLVSSHVLVQIAKRMVGRDRPSRLGIGRVFLVEPDQFSFPSGHAAASMAVALAFAAVLPSIAVPVLVIAMLVGISRVALGVHFPGDVAAGQALAVATHFLLMAFGA